MIWFTQLLFPNGKRTAVVIERPKEVEAKAKYLASQGYVFEIENDHGRIWMSCLKHGKEEWAVDRVCKDGPEVPENVDAMINEAYMNLKQKEVHRER